MIPRGRGEARLYPATPHVNGTGRSAGRAASGGLDSQRRSHPVSVIQEYLATLRRVLPRAVPREIPWLADGAEHADTDTASTSVPCFPRHPVGNKFVIQLGNVALGHVTPTDRHTEAIRYPADKRQLLLG